MFSSIWGRVSLYGKSLNSQALMDVTAYFTVIVNVSELLHPLALV